jgi:hypothetical protein
MAYIVGKHETLYEGDCFSFTVLLFMAILSKKKKKKG